MAKVSILFLFSKKEHKKIPLLHLFFERIRHKKSRYQRMTAGFIIIFQSPCYSPNVTFSPSRVRMKLHLKWQYFAYITIYSFPLKWGRAWDGGFNQRA